MSLARVTFSPIQHAVILRHQVEDGEYRFRRQDHAVAVEYGRFLFVIHASMIVYPILESKREISKASRSP